MAEHGLVAERPTADSAALYLRFLAEEDRNPATIQLHLAAIEFHLNDYGVSVARERIVRDTMATVRREYHVERFLANYRTKGGFSPDSEPSGFKSFTRAARRRPEQAFY